MYYAKQASEARSVQGVNSHKNSIAHVVKISNIYMFKLMHIKLQRNSMKSSNMNSNKEQL